LADGVVVGSAIVRRIAEIGVAPDLPEKVAAFVRPIAEAVHGVSIK
jgi:tryptophan synthase alpha subunit